MDRNRTVVDAVIPPRQSKEAHRRDMKAPCGCDSRKPVRPVGTVFFPEPVTIPEQMSDVVVLASATHKTRRSVKHGLRRFSSPNTDTITITLTLTQGT